MKIAIIGAGSVGGTLGTRWALSGHEIIFGARDPNSPNVRRALDQIGRRGRASSVAEAVAETGVVVLATPWSAAQDALRSAGSLSGKTLIDCVNPIQDGALDVGLTTSAAEQIASWAPGAHVVKAFNMTGAGNMSDPVYGEERASMLIAGDDGEAKTTVTDLARQLGFDVVDAGPLQIARYLEPLAMLWVNLAYGQRMGSNIAFRLMRR